MLQTSWRWSCRLAWMLLAGAAAAQVSSGDPAERERIARERAEVEARFQTARSGCEALFASTACLNTARAERRSALEGLKREEALLDTAQRRQRAADRMRRINDKVREADARPPASALPATPGRGPIEKKVRSSPRPPRAGAAAPKAEAMAPESRALPDGAALPKPARQAGQPVGRDDAARRAARRAAYEQRQAEAQARRDAAARRNAARAAGGKAAAPLPPRPGVPAE